MRRFITKTTAGLLAAVALSGALVLGCSGEEEQRAERVSTTTASPDFYPKVRVAAQIEESSDLVLALDWRNLQVGSQTYDWNRIRVGRVPADRLAAGMCFSAPQTGVEVGEKAIRVKVTACVRDSGTIELYLRGGHPSGEYQERKFVGGISPELQANSVGRWIRADANLTTLSLAGSAPVRNTRSPVRTASSADCSTLHNRAMAADRKALTPAAGASERRAADAAWATYDRNCR